MIILRIEDNTSYRMPIIIEIKYASKQEAKEELKRRSLPDNIKTSIEDVPDTYWDYFVPVVVNDKDSLIDKIKKAKKRDDEAN